MYICPHSIPFQLPYRPDGGVGGGLISCRMSSRVPRAIVCTQAVVPSSHPDQKKRFYLLYIYIYIYIHNSFINKCVYIYIYIYIHT